MRRTLCWSKFPALLTFLILTGMLSLQSMAASFDCKKASLSVEKLICSNPSLSRIDEELYAVYQKMLENLSSEARATVVEGQRNWLRFVKRICFRSTKSEGLGSCMEAQYENRIRTLKNGRHVLSGGYQVYPVTKYVAELHEADNELDTPKWLECKFVYPQIDNKNLSVEKIKFVDGINKLILSRYRKHYDGFACRDDADTYFSVFLEDISDNWFMLNELDSWCCAAHGLWTNDVFLFRKNDFKQINGEDFFNGSGWKQKINEAAASLLRQDGHGEKGETDVGAEDVTRWWPTKKGLRIEFPLYTVDGFAAGTPSVVLLWKDIHPLMTKEAISESKKVRYEYFEKGY